MYNKLHAHLLQQQLNGVFILVAWGATMKLSENELLYAESNSMFATLMS